MSGARLDPGHPVLGTAWFTADDPAAAAGSIEAYLDAGGRVLDTARIYGDSEDVLGDWIARAHEFLALWAEYFEEPGGAAALPRLGERRGRLVRRRERALG